MDRIADGIRQIDDTEGIVVGGENTSKEKRKKEWERRRRRKDSGADNWGNGVIRYCDGNRAPLQGGSGWSISGALYVTNLRTRPSLMPVRGPW